MRRASLSGGSSGVETGKILKNTFGSLVKQYLTYHNSTNNIPKDIILFSKRVLCLWRIIVEVYTVELVLGNGHGLGIGGL